MDKPKPKQRRDHNGIIPKITEELKGTFGGQVSHGMEVGEEIPTLNKIYKILDGKKNLKRGLQGYSNTYFSLFPCAKT